MAQASTPTPRPLWVNAALAAVGVGAAAAIVVGAFAAQADVPSAPIGADYCFETPRAGEFSNPTVQSCDEPHQSERFASIRADSNDEANRRCQELFSDLPAAKRQTLPDDVRPFWYTDTGLAGYIYDCAIYSPSGAMLGE